MIFAFFRASRASRSFGPGDVRCLCSLSGDGSGETKTRPDDIEEQMALLDAARERQPLAYGSAGDFQLLQAVRHLKGQPMQLSKQPSGPTLARQH